MLFISLCIFSGLKLYDSCCDPVLVSKIISDGISATSVVGQLGTENAVCTLSSGGSQESQGMDRMVVE